MTKRRWVHRSTLGTVIFNPNILEEEEKIQNISIIFELLSSTQNGKPVPLEQIRYFFDFGELNEEEIRKVEKIMYVEDDEPEDTEMERDDILYTGEPNYCHYCDKRGEVSYICGGCYLTYCEECAKSTSYECACGPIEKI